MLYIRYSYFFIIVFIYLNVLKKMFHIFNSRLFYFTVLPDYTSIRYLDIYICY